MNEQQKIVVEENAAAKLEKAKILVVTRQAYSFWGDTLRRQYTADWSIPTAATNGTLIKYNPAFIDGLTLGQVVFLLAHEVLHIKLGHHLRRGERDPLRWNYAADYAINAILRDEIAKSRGEKVPMQWIDEALFEPKYRNNTEEAIYADMCKEQPQPQPEQPDQSNDQSEGEEGDQSEDGQGQPGDQSEDGQPGDGQPGDGQANGDQPGGGTPDIMTTEEPEGFGDMSDAEKQQEIDNHDAQVRKDNAAAHAAGTLPGAVKEIFDISAAPLRDWKTILADFCLSRSRSEYDWNRYNRSYANYKIYLPDLGGVRIESAVVAIDVSGSINQPQLTRFLVELNDIVVNAEVEETTVMQVNTRITQIDEYQDGDEIDPNVTAGGGTSFKPPFEYVEENDIDPEFLIYFTDGYCHSFAEEPDYPVLWVLFNDNQSFDPPYGEVAVMDEV